MNAKFSVFAISDIASYSDYSTPDKREIMKAFVSSDISLVTAVLHRFFTTTE